MHQGHVGNVGDPSGELLGEAAMPGPVSYYDIAIPSDPALAGVTVATQALHIGGVTPYALSNALDLVVGM